MALGASSTAVLSASCVLTSMSMENNRCTVAAPFASEIDTAADTASRQNFKRK